MELVSADEDRGLTVRFSGPEFAALMGIVYAVRLEYSGMDAAVLNLSREQVLQLETDIYEMSAQARNREKYGK